MKRWDAASLALGTYGVQVGRAGRFRPRSFFCSFRNVVERDAAENAGTLCRSHWMKRRAGKFAPRFLQMVQVWTAERLRRSLWNAPSDGARRETLGRSVARSGMIGRRKTGKRDDGLASWEEARGCCGVWRVVLSSSSRVWLRIPVLTRRRSVVPFRASVRKGRGVKRWDASELAASGGSRSEFGPRSLSRSLGNVV